MSGLDPIVGGGVQATPGKQDKASLKKAAQAFEAVFIRQIMSSARTEALGEDIMGSDAGNQFRDLADARTADDMAAKGTFGIADLLMAQFGKRVAPATTVPDATAPIAIPGGTGTEKTE